VPRFCKSSNLVVLGPCSSETVFTAPFWEVNYRDMHFSSSKATWTCLAFFLSQLRTRFVERAFTYPDPSDLCAVTDPGLLRKRLKSHFFGLAFCHMCLLTIRCCNAPMTYSCNRRTTNLRMMMMIEMSLKYISTWLVDCNNHRFQLKNASQL